MSEFSAVQAVDAVEARHLGPSSCPCQRLVEAAEAAEAEVEAIMKEEVWTHRYKIMRECSLVLPLPLWQVLRRALLDPEGEARRRRVLAARA